MDSFITSILAGAALGWIAIPHCFGMCGPLHVSVCAVNRQNSLQSLTLFNLGRIIGYTFAGLLFGAFGEFVNLGPSNYCCQLTSVKGAMLSLLFPSITILIIGIFGICRRKLKVPKIKWMSKMFSGGKLKITTGGICTTLIPCGMLYAAFAMAIGTGSWIGGMLFMLSFAITQTFFMQLGISIGKLWGDKWSKKVNKLFPWLCIIISFVYLYFFFIRIQIV